MKNFKKYSLVTLLLVSMSFSTTLHVLADDSASPDPSAGVSPSPTVTTTPDPSSSPSVSPDPTPSPTATPDPSLSPSPSPTVSSSTSDSQNNISSTTPTDPENLDTTGTTTGTTTNQTAGDPSLNNNNTSTTTNIVDTDAGTGTNLASSTGTTTITTGDAGSQTNIVNTNNINLVDSNGQLDFLSHNGDGTINLENLGSTGSSTCSDCSLSTSTLSSSPSDLNASTTNTANISNLVVVRSNTGDNTASSTDGGAAISTGNAYAIANIANIANANLINSNYLLLVLNNFGSMNGDIVLPTADFFNNFLNSSNSTQSISTGLVSNNSNTANVTNNITTSSNTGNNSATDTDSLIQTGNAYSGTNVLNTVNQNLVGGGSVGLIFRVFGNWSGQVFNLPAGFSSQLTSDGIEIFLNAPNSTDPTSSSTSPLSFLLNSQNTNNATINNSVTVDANTGNNQAIGSTTSQIKTGNAYSAANIINIANTNIIGRNWINAIVNVFGDWNGNISFGQPNLWIGTKADFTNGETGPNSEITYHYTIKNNGDAPAHNVVLKQDLGSDLLSFEQGEGSGSWDVGTLQPGESKTFDHKVKVSNSIPEGQTTIESTVNVTETESDGNPQDNTDLIDVALTWQNLNNYFGPVNNNPVLHGMPANFVISKTNDAGSFVAPGDSVDYKIHLVNNGGFADHAMVHDEITDESGNVVHSEDWDLGEVQTFEDITLTYTAAFTASTTPGWYTNTAQVYSADNLFPDSPVATSTIYIATPAPLVRTVSSHHITLAKNKNKNKNSGLLTLTNTNLVKATTTSTTTLPILANINLDQQHNFLLASVVGAGISYSYWLLLLLLLLIAAYIYHKRKQLEEQTELIEVKEELKLKL